MLAASEVKKFTNYFRQHLDTLCQCPQKCSERVPQRSKDELFKIFAEMDSEDVQNKFLQKFIEARPVANRLFSKETTPNGKLLRRIHCKYRIPSILPEDFMASEYITYNC